MCPNTQIEEVTRMLTYAEALNEALAEEMERDTNVFLIGEDIGCHGGAFKVTKGLFDRFGPKRVRDAPISEEAFVGAAIGAAMVGARPVVDVMYIDFITLAMDAIINQAAKSRYMFGGGVSVPLVIRTQCGAGRGNAGQHSQSLEALFYHIPGLKVCMPSSPADAKGLLKSSIRDESPVIFIEHKLLYFQKGPVGNGENLIELGKAEVKRPGSDVTIIATSYMVPLALVVAEELANRGIECEVIDPRTLVPLDLETMVLSIKKTHKAVIIQEAVRRGGVASDIAAELTERTFDYLDAPILRVTSLDGIVPYAMNLEQVFMPDKAKVIKAILEIT
jgi:pyruvate/2-oxoglutarate/acetoin dehydrogenase E1 component